MCYYWQSNYPSIAISSLSRNSTNFSLRSHWNYWLMRGKILRLNSQAVIFFGTERNFILAKLNLKIILPQKISFSFLQEILYFARTFLQCLFYLKYSYFYPNKSHWIYHCRFDKKKWIFQLLFICVSQRKCLRNKFNLFLRLSFCTLPHLLNGNVEFKKLYMK